MRDWSSDVCSSDLGWVYRSDIDLLKFDDLFKKEVKDDPSL